MKLTIEELKKWVKENSENGKRADAIRELISIRELKGDQVPVAYLYMGDAMECKHVELAEDMDEGQAENCVPLFTAPQKSVVLPVADHETEDGYKYYREETVKAAIEAAGGIVKEAE